MIHWDLTKLAKHAEKLKQNGAIINNKKTCNVRTLHLKRNKAGNLCTEWTLCRSLYCSNLREQEC